MSLCPPIVLSIAGFDPSSGAGVTADIKTISAHGCYGVSVITAMTVQSTAGVRRLSPVSPELISESLDELAADVEIASIRVGMLGSMKAAVAVAEFLQRSECRNIVVDPVMSSTSGAELVDKKGASVLRERIFPLATLITPNIAEAAALTGLEVRNLPEMRSAAKKLHEMGAKAVVITGGHLETAIDLLSFTDSSGTQQEVFRSPKLRSNSTHGTGCAFATAIACHLAHGRGLPEAVLLAKAYISAAIANAQPIGRGVGPVHHLYRSGQRRPVNVPDPEPVHS